MLTVEELVIEGLYHRLVLINVKKQGTLSENHTPKNKHVTNIEDEIDSDDQCNHCPVSAVEKVEYQRQDGQLGKSGTNCGLGFLVMTVMNQHLKRAYGLTSTFQLQSVTNDLCLSSSEKISERETIPGYPENAGELMSQQVMEIEEKVQTILNTGEIQLLRTTLTSPDMRIDLPPIWSFGPSLSFDTGPASHVNENPQQVLPQGISQNPQQVLPCGISLDNCSQFSVMSLQDRRDVDGRSLVFVQTDEEGARPDRLELPDIKQQHSSAKLHENQSKKDFFTDKQVIITPAPLPTLTTCNTSIFVHRSDEYYGEIDQNLPRPSNHIRPALSIKTGEKHLLDSSILDMIQELESNLDVNMPHSNKEICGFSTDHEFDTKNSMEKHTDWMSMNMSNEPEKIIDELRIRGSMDDYIGESEAANKMAGSYKLFAIGDQSLVQPLETGSIAKPQFVKKDTGINLAEDHCIMKIENGHESDKYQCFISTAEDAFQDTYDRSYHILSENEGTEQIGQISSTEIQGLDDDGCLSKPEASIIFSIETSEAKSEDTVFSVTDIIDDALSQCTSCSQSHLATSTVITQDRLNTITESQNNQLGSISGCPSDVKRSNIEKEVSGIKGGLEKQGQSIGKKYSLYHSKYVQQDADYFTFMGSIPADTDKQQMFKSCGSPGYDKSIHSTQPKFQSTPFTNRLQSSKLVENSHQDIFEDIYNNVTDDPANDSGISVALYPPSRVISYRDQRFSTNSNTDLSTSVTHGESSEGEDTMYELDLPYDVPAYLPYPEWMTNLPEDVHDVALTQLAIPGSHISLAIDREMRMDMDFSRGNYEMADFLRKLPNLAIFNNFRGLMKKIWKAWMPKQTLTVPQQLEAGVRYFDLYIAKLRGALYGEHGLYTRQLKRYLQQMKQFLECHPHEVLILHFSSLSQLSPSDKRHLVTSLFQIFGARLARSGIPGNTSLKYLWQNKKQVIVIFPDKDMSLLRNHIFYGLVWSDFEVVSPLPQKQNIPELKEYLLQLDGDNGPVGAAIGKKFFVLRAVLSPDMTAVFGDFRHQSMRELTEMETEPAVQEWLKHWQHKLNIVALDFVGIGNSIPMIVMLNLHKKESVV